MLKVRRRSQFWYGYEYTTALITYHEKWVHSRTSQFHGGYPYCESVHWIEPDIALIVLREWGGWEFGYFMMLTDDDHVVQTYQLTDVQYWEINPLPF